MQVAIIGYGRMGKEIQTSLFSKNISIRFIAKDIHELSQNVSLLEDGDVCIEFTHPDSAYENLKLLASVGAKVVCGTTGWTKRKEEIEQLFIRSKGSFLYASNFSVGMNIVFILNEKLAQLTEHLSEFSIRIEETHHTNKIDKPSGTAVSLAEGVLDNNKRYQSWSLGPNSIKNVAIISHRVTNVIGNHEIHYSSPSEDIILTHYANKRSLFASGAVIAAQWLSSKEGVFSMKDVLGL